MTRTIFFLFACAALLCASCERHPASELEGEHGAAPETSTEGAKSTTEAAPALEATPAPAAAPAGTPAAAPKYFPDSK